MCKIAYIFGCGLLYTFTIERLLNFNNFLPPLSTLEKEKKRREAFCFIVKVGEIGDYNR